MKENFETALRHVLDFEGGYVDHPDDPGGATNLGITRATLARFKGRPVSKAEVRALEVETAREIYRRFYWDPLRCDEMPAGIDLALFDGGVNQGTGRAARLLQSALKVSVDGIIGPVTLRAAQAADSMALLNAFMARRMHAYGRLSRLFRTFGLGWSRRLMAAHSASQALIFEADKRRPTSTQFPPDKRIDDMEKPLMIFLIDRLREPSTYAGVAAFLAGIGLFGLSENEWDQIFGAVASVAGVVAMLMRDGTGGEEGEQAQRKPTVRRETDNSG
ncbi:glycoside hydrolase family 108 protein [Dichotomicrobium thermohalophilum]|uniref:Lysozyme family protein n=1 Tax=Dichotomicrobium thermohalophilum TaxID=933063 RepID=A0A397Q8B9_9HYPH|nr:glycosyl hydrolase 108 family protein [Dichotomicrobium thermohalophilum]RIA56749.1 lysozyme family protein [Dichotomicrobium thermohalophilum]